MDTERDKAQSDPRAVEGKSAWFADETSLFNELRAVRAEGGGGTPTITGYSDLRELRRGGQGIVYTATQDSTKRRVAIKILLEGSLASTSTRRRFEREIEVVAGLTHPNIVRVYDSGRTLGTAGGFPYYIMEFVDGVPLDEAIRQMRTEVDNGTTAICEIFATIADAVNYAHQRGVIHRDLKPSNIRVEGGRPRVLDFGLAKVLGAAHIAATVTGDSGVFLGSLPWASPEQAEGDQNRIDVRSDVYSIGVMLHHALSGVFPYDVSGSMRQTLEHIQRSEPAALPAGTDADLRTIVKRCLAKEPERRYQTAGELADDIRLYLAGEPIRARRDSLVYTLQKSAHRNRLLIGASCAVMLALGAGLAWAVRAQRQAEVARDAATSQSDQKERTVLFLQQMLQSADPAQSGRNAKVVDVLDKVAADIAGGDSNLPARVEAVVHGTLGSSYSALGDAEKGELHLRASLKIMESLPDGTATWDWEDTRSNLALLLSRQGRVDEGLQLALASWRHGEQLFGLDAPKTLILHRRYGEALYNAGKLKESLTELEATANVQMKALGPTHPETVDTRQSVAILYRQTSRPKDAELMYLDVLKLVDKSRKPAVYSDIIHNLASALQDQGRLDEAVARYRETIEIRTRVYGEDHPSTLLSMSDLSTALIEQDKLKGPGGAIELLRQVVANMERKNGPLAMNTLLAIGNLAKAVQDAGDLDEASTLFEREYSGQLQTLGEEHPQTLITAANIAVLYAMKKQPDKALEMNLKILEVQKRTIGPDHFSALICLNNIGKTYDDLNQGEKAERAYREVVERAVKAMAPGHYSIALFKNNFARRLFANGKRDEAYPLINEALEAMTQTYGIKDKRVVGCARKLALELDKDKRATEAAAVRAKYEIPTDPPAATPAK